MIARLNGKLISKSSTDAIIDCGGVGYNALITVNTSEQLPEIGADVTLQTLLIAREDSLNFFGFIDETEKEAFKTLISISGIGPKMALGILSSVQVGELIKHILEGNIIALKKLPGIGKKTAERLHYELKDKITQLAEKDALSPDKVGSALVKEEAVSALAALGYSKALAEKCVTKAIQDSKGAELTAENLIKTSLKYAMK